MQLAFLPSFPPREVRLEARERASEWPFVMMLLLLAQAASFMPTTSFAPTSATRGRTSPHLARPMVSRVAQPAMLDAASVLSSPLLDPIATGFELVTLVPQPFWLLLILLPNWKVPALLV